MNKKNLADLKKWFLDYISKYYKNDPEYDYAITLKKNHTMRVCQNIIELSKSLGLSDQDMIMAEIIALFHDLGRFKQYAVYNTFKDADSENHAKLSVRELAFNKVLSCCTLAQRRTIIKAVAWHNALSLPKNCNDTDLFFMKLIRDADKLDIWGVLAKHYQDKTKNSVVDLGLPDSTEYSQQAIQSFYKRQLVQLKDIKFLNDFKLLQLSWIYDINFPVSLYIAKNRGDLEKIGASLPQSQEILEVINNVFEYINSVINNQDRLNISVA